MQNSYSDLDFIKDFSKIKIAYICKRLKIDKSNLWTNRVSTDKIKKVKNEIKKELKKIEEKEKKI